MAETHLYGYHAVTHALKVRGAQVKALFLLSGDAKKRAHFEALCAPYGVSVTHCERSTLDRLAQSTQHQGVVIQAPLPQIRSLHWLKTHLAAQPFLWILDGITDPQNLGAILRVAAACQVHAVIGSAHRSARLTPVVHKVSSGGAEYVPMIQVTNLVQTMQWLQQQGVWIYGTDVAAETDLSEVVFADAKALVLGAEGSGMRHLTRQCCDHLVRIHYPGPIESLNVAVSAALCGFAALRGGA